MSKSIKTALILIVAGIVLVVLAWCLAKGDVTNFNTKNAETVREEYKCTTDVTEIEITETSESIEIKEENVDKVTVSYCNEKNKKLYKVTEKNGKLKLEKIKNTVSFGIFINLDDTRVYVSVPKDYHGSIDVETTSGSVYVENLELSDFNIDGSSGSLNVSNVSSENGFKIELTSGSINLSNIKTKKAEVKNSSGTIAIEDLEAEELDVNNSSGTIKLTDVSVTDSVDVLNTSGSIRLDRLSAGKSIKLENTSGGIRGTIVGKESDFAIDTDYTSGSCNLKDSKNGEKTLDASTTSGDIKIEFTE